MLKRHSCLPVCGVVGADEALLLDVLLAAAHALDHFALGDERTAGAAAAVGHRDIPCHFAGARVERDEMRVAQRDDTACRCRAPCRACAMLPPRRCSQIRSPVLPSSAWTMPPVLFRIDRAVVGERRGLIRAALVHRPDPLQLQLLRVVARDLRQRAVVRRD